jgi:RNA polymerase sigma factor (sigma-70 family)
MDGFTQYINGIVRYPLLTKQQEIMLARQVQAWIHTPDPTPKQIKQGKRAYHKLINCNLRLVVSIAKRYVPRARRTEMFDIVQEGNIGLAHGIKKFDPERGYALSTYVYWWIRQSISRHLTYHDRVIRLPTQAIEVLAKLRGWAVEFEAKAGRTPSIEECAEYCKIKPARLQEYLVHSNDCSSLDSGSSSDLEGDSTALIDLVTDGDHGMENIDDMFNSEVLYSYLDQLSEIDRRIVMDFYGLNGAAPKTYMQISKELGICRERTRQRCHKALNRLKFLSTKYGVY